MFCFLHTSTFQLLHRPWSQVSSVLPPGSGLPILWRTRFSNPTARRFSTECYITLSRVPQVNLCTSKKCPPIFTSMHSGGLDITKLTYTRLKDSLIRHRGQRSYIYSTTRIASPYIYDDTNTRDRSITHKLAKMRFDEIFDFTAGVYFYIICDLNLLKTLPPSPPRTPLHFLLALA